MPKRRLERVKRNDPGAGVYAASPTVNSRPKLTVVTVSFRASCTCRKGR
jgi:hypothetical protein